MQLLFDFCYGKQNFFLFFLKIIETLHFLYRFASRCFFFLSNNQVFLTTVSYHYLEQHIPVFQSFSHTVHDLMSGLMSCSLHVEGHCIVLMNHEKGKHTSLCEQLNNPLSVIYCTQTIYQRSALSISTDTECFIKTTYFLKVLKPVNTDSLLTTLLHLLSLSLSCYLVDAFKATISVLQAKADQFSIF